MHVASLGREVEVSIVDVGTICVFIRAEDLGLTGAELPGAFDPRHFAAAEEIRQAAAASCGLSSSGAKSITPFQIVVGPPRDHAALTGPVMADEIDFVARQLNGDGWVHKAFSGGASTCTAVAAQIAGTSSTSAARSTPRRAACASATRAGCCRSTRRSNPLAAKAPAGSCEKCTSRAPCGD